MIRRQLPLVILAAVLAVVSLAARPAFGQNPVQWMGNPRMAIDRAAEHSMPLLFWVTEREDTHDDDLKDAQSRALRDPTVVSLAQKRFVPVRVSQTNTRVIQEAQKLGLPTEYGQYIAVVTPEGKLVRKISPTEVAEAQTLAVMLHEALKTYLNELYASKLQPLITSPDAPKNEVRVAVQTVWKLGILMADKDCVALLDRDDMTPSDHARMCQMLGAMATPACIDALLDRAAQGEQTAIDALNDAEVGALDTLLKELPIPQQPPDRRQIAAYRAACRISRAPMRPDTFWGEAQPSQREKVLEELRRRAEPVLEYWQDSTGRWR